MGKKRMKRAVSWLLALSLVSALLPPAAVRAQAAPQTAPVTETVTRTTQPGTVGQTTAEPVMVDQTTLQPGAADQTTPQPETVDQATPEPETADRTTPQPRTADQTTPQPETADRTTPQPRTADQTTPQPRTADQTTPKPETADRTTPQPETADRTTPQPRTADRTTPQPETVDRTTPEPETADRTTPQPETVDQTTPQPETVDQTTPQPETVGQTTPEPVPQNSALGGTRNSDITLTVVGPCGTDAGTAGETVIHPLSRIKVTGSYTSGTLMIRKGNTTSTAGTIGTDGLSDMICNLGGYGGLGLTDGQECTFYLGDSTLNPEAQLTVTYQAAIPSEDLTVQNFTSKAGSDLMVDLSWDHPAADPDGTGEGWTYTLSGYAAGSSGTVSLYQKDESGKVTSTTSLTVTGQKSASVATDPSLGPVTFVLTVRPGVSNYQYYQKTSVVGPNPSDFKETVAPTVSISTSSYLSGLTYKASATVTDAWGTPSHAVFTIQRENGGSYEDTGITGTDYVKSTAFNGSAYTSNVELNLFGQEAGTYRLKVVGYDTCGNASQPAYKDFTLTGSETGYPLLTGLTASGTPTGVTVDASQLAFTDAAIDQIWEEVAALSTTTYTGRPTSREDLKTELEALLQMAKVQYTLEYNVGGSTLKVQHSVPAEGEGSWDYTFPVGMTFASGKPQLAGNLSGSSIRPSGQYNFAVSLNFNPIDGYFDNTQYGWVYKIYLNNWCTSAPVLCGMSGANAAPTAGEIQLVNPVTDGMFDSGSSFTVTASDDVLLQGGQFFWRKSGTSQWIAGEAPDAAAAESENGVTFTADYSTMFGYSTSLTQGQYDIRFQGTDWAGKTVVVEKTFTYGKLPAPENVRVSVEENAATVTWDKVDGAASYRIYVNGTAQNTTVTDTTYTFYMEPKGKDTYTYYFAVAALTTGGGEGERSEATEPVSSQEDKTAPQVTSVESTDDYGEHSFTITGFDNGRVKSYRWELLPAEGAGDTVLLEIGKAVKTPGDIHGELKIYDWMDTKDVLQNRLNSVLYPERSFPNDTPNPTYFTQNGDGTYTLKDGLYRLRVYVYDTADNESQPYDYPFRVANVGPDLPSDFTHQAEATLSVSYGTSSVLTGTISWDSLPEGSPGVRLWYPSNKYYGTKEARQEAMDAISDASDIPAGFILKDFPTAAGENSYTMSLRANYYYFYVIAAYNEFGTAGPIQFGTFDTCFENDPLNVTAVTFNDVDITVEDNNKELEQGGTLSVTVTSEVVTGGYIQLCRMYEGAEKVLAGGPYGGGDQFFKEQGNGTYAATITYRIPTEDFTWSGPQNVYVRLSHNSYTHIHTEDIPVGLQVMQDTEKPTLNSVTPDFGGAISGEAFAFTLNAWDNSKVIDKVKVWQSPYGADDWTSLGEFSWNGGTLTLDTTELTANASGNIMLKFAVTDKAGNESEAKSGAYALANSPIPAPTGLTAAAGERQIVLNWNPVQRLDAAGYHIYRAVDNGEYVQVGTASKGQNTYTDTDNGAYLDPTKAYSYKVAAYSDQIEEEYLSAATSWLRPLEQTGAPTILSLEPWQGSAFRSPATVTAKVQDEIGVTEIKLEFALLGKSSTAEPTGETQWQTIQTFTGTELVPDAEGGKTYTVTAQWTLDTAAVTESWYALRVTASNSGSKTAVSTV